MEKEMKEIEEIVRKYGDIQSLMHYVNVKTLKEEHNKQKENKATGIDKVTKEEYSINLNERLEELITRMKKFSYKPLPVRRTYIPKGNEELRPLGIPTYEDKLVQGVMANCLNAVYENEFLEFSYGFRPNRNCHQAIKEINQIIMTKKVNYILDCDIKGFFNNVNHELLIKCVEKKIKDKNFVRYIKRFLIGGIMEDNKYYESTKGTPQGGLISPILANIYLHYALDKWYEYQVKPELKGESYLIRYADDFVVLFQYEEEAKEFYKELKERMKQACLELAEEKTKIIPFGRYKGTKDTFNFLGFTFSNGITQTGKYTVLKKTNKKKLKQKKAKVKKFLKDNMHLGIRETIKRINKMLRGHYAYYGITGNYDEMFDYYQYVQEMLFWTKTRRSQRKNKYIEVIKKVLEVEPLIKPKIYVNLWT